MMSCKRLDIMKYHAPRKGSLGYVRKRTRRIYPRVISWPDIDTVKPLGFPAYKVGMLSVVEEYQREKSLFHGIKRAIAATILEAPPVKVVGIRVYDKTVYGLKSINEIWTPELSDPEIKYLSRKTNLPKKVRDEDYFQKKKEALSQELDRLMNPLVRIIIRTKPELTYIGKKKPEIMEIQIGGSPKDSFNYALDKLGKDISITEVLEAGQFIDSIGVTKGKGFQGVVKRFGVKILPPKTKKEKRAVGSLGPWTPGRVMWTVPNYGQLGFFKRTEYNKQVLAIITENLEKINPKGGWLHYGLIKNPAVIIKGSVQGPPKRLLLLRHAIRPKRAAFKPKLFELYFNKERLDVPL